MQKQKGGQRIPRKPTQYHMYGNHGKTKIARKTTILHKHVNFNIDQLRENAQKLPIMKGNEERREIEEAPSKVAASENCTRSDNNELWKLDGGILYTKQTTNSPHETKNAKRTARTKNSQRQSGKRLYT